MELERVRTGEDTWRETEYLYTPEGRVQKQAVDLGGYRYAVTEYDYDLNGNLTYIKLPEGGEIRYDYDCEDRRVCERHHGGETDNVFTYTYDAAGNLTCITDRDGNRQKTEYDLMDREIRHTAADGGISTTAYDLNGNPVMKINPMQHEAGKRGISYAYDLCNRPASVTSPDGGVLENNAYNRAGSLIKQTDASGSGISMGYDLAGRRISAVTTGGSTQGWSHDALGNVNAVTDGMGNRTYFKTDRWGRITGITKADRSRESYTYDYAGNMTSSCDGEGHTVLMEYNALGQMIRRTDPAGRTETFEYDRESGRRTAMTQKA